MVLGSNSKYNILFPYDNICVMCTVFRDPKNGRIKTLFFVVDEIARILQTVANEYEIIMKHSQKKHRKYSCVFFKKSTKKSRYIKLNIVPRYRPL